MSQVTVEGLKAAPEIFLSEFSSRTRVAPGTETFIIHGTPSTGAQKTAVLGKTSLNPVFAGHGPPDHRVCLKQSYYRSRIEDQGREKIAITPQPDVTQYKELLSEFNNQAWAAALLGCLYLYIDKFFQDNPALWIDIPRFRFVEMALVKGLGASTDSRGKIYLAEEYIDKDIDGVFRKYINNNSATPLFKDGDVDHNWRAEFLAFAQHFQHWVTQGAMYTSDFQGK